MYRSYHFSRYSIYKTIVISCYLGLLLFFSLSSTNELIWLVLWTPETKPRRYVLNVILMPEFTSLQDESVFKIKDIFFHCEKFLIVHKNSWSLPSFHSWNVIILCFNFSKSIVCCDSKNSMKKIHKRISMKNILWTYWKL